MYFWGKSRSWYADDFPIPTQSRYTSWRGLFSWLRYYHLLTPVEYGLGDFFSKWESSLDESLLWTCLDCSGTIAHYYSQIEYIFSLIHYIKNWFKYIQICTRNARRRYITVAVSLKIISSYIRQARLAILYPSCTEMKITRWKTNCHVFVILEIFRIGLKIPLVSWELSFFSCSTDTQCPRISRVLRREIYPWSSPYPDLSPPLHYPTGYCCIPNLFALSKIAFFWSKVHVTFL